MVSERSTSPRLPAERAGAGGGGGGGESHVHHPRSFKLRFAPPRERGRSDVSLVKPLGVPATVASKFYVRERDGAPAAAAEAALRRVRDLFQLGPRDKYPRPKLSSHEYGWWSGAARPADPWLRHHIRDSPWMRERLRLLPPERPRPR